LVSVGWQAYSFQIYSSENLGVNEVINQDYHKLAQDDWVLEVGQETINILSEHSRSVIYVGVERARTCTIVITQYSRCNLHSWLLANCVFNKFQEEGQESLKDLTLELEVTTDRKRVKLFKFIESNF